MTTAPNAEPRSGSASRWRAALTPALAGVFAVACPGAARAEDGLRPSAVFVQLGSAGGTREVATGLIWDWQREWALGSGRLSGYWEASASGWSYRSLDERRTWLGKFGAIPVLRWRPDDGASPWFGEIGIGLTFTTNLYETEGKRFSTRFNFGDHLGIGRSFGAAREHEIALRVEHVSNAGIKEPNPGENFVQLRYTRHFR